MCLGHRLQHGFHIQRLDGMDVNQFCADTLLFQDFNGFNGFPYEVAASKDADVFAFLNHLGLPYLEFLVGRREVWDFWAAETKINGAFVFRCRDGGVHGLVVVTGHDDRHVGQHLHQPDVLENLMGGTVFAESNARMRSSYFNIFIGISNTLPDLIVDTACGKGGESTSEWHETAERHAGSHVGHVGFGDAGLEETFWELLGEVAHFQ